MIAFQAQNTDFELLLTVGRIHSFFNFCNNFLSFRNFLYLPATKYSNTIRAMIDQDFPKSTETRDTEVIC